MVFWVFFFNDSKILTYKFDLCMPNFIALSLVVFAINEICQWKYNIFRKIRTFFDHSFSKCKCLYFEKLLMDFNNLKTKNLISIYSL